MSAIIDQAAIDRVAEYFTKAVDALTPVAKQAYEIGLKTIQIDALAVIIPNAFFLIVNVIILLLIFRSHYKNYSKAVKEMNEENANRRKLNEEKGYIYYSYKKLDDYYDGNRIFAYCMASLIPLVITLVTTIHLSSVWLWVKLFSPELYLANQILNKAVSIVK